VNGSLGSPSQFTAAGWEQLKQDARQNPSDLPVLADWFGLLGSGKHVAAMGNSDTHHPNGGVGYPRNFIFVNKDAPSSVAPREVRDAIRAQRVSVGNGCFVELRVGGTSRMGVGDAISPADLQGLQVRVQAPPHVEVKRLELYQNGIAQTLVFDDDGVSVDDSGALSAALPTAPAEDPSLRLASGVRGLSAERDLVLVAVARGGSGLEPTNGGGTYCYSAPLYVDEGADGWVGWLADTQQVVP
jgi:hypothetical protein